MDWNSEDRERLILPNNITTSTITESEKKFYADLLKRHSVDFIFLNEGPSWTNRGESVEGPRPGGVTLYLPAPNLRYFRKTVIINHWGHILRHSAGCRVHGWWGQICLLRLDWRKEGQRVWSTDLGGIENIKYKFLVAIGELCCHKSSYYVTYSVSQTCVAIKIVV
jgi:hypothetical protein